MPDWTKWLGPMAGHAGPERMLREFAVTDLLQADGRAEREGDAWRIEARDEGLLGRLLHRSLSLRLGEVADPGQSNCVLICRATTRAEALEGKAYLEMWCRIPGRGEFFSRGYAFDQSLEGTTDWTTLETPFLLRDGEVPDRIRLNLVIEGKGTVRIRDAALLAAPLG